jgi:hypothetical protein
LNFPREPALEFVNGLAGLKVWSHDSKGAIVQMRISRPSNYFVDDDPLGLGSFQRRRLGPIHGAHVACPGERQVHAIRGAERLR